jgi:hypothetical protein
MLDSLMGCDDKKCRLLYDDMNMIRYYYQLLYISEKILFLTGKLRCGE